MFTHLDALPYAIKASLESPCRSKRGAVVFDPHPMGIFRKIYATGYNRPPALFICDGSDQCKANCAATAIHAEQMAIIRLLQTGASCSGLSMLHIKTVHGIPVPSAGPSCLQCSKLILEVGISSMWLLLAEGWREYTALEFHELTLLHHQIPVKRVGI